MKIGELAKTAKCTVETIRYYEKEQLMPEPNRTENNYRSYGQQHVERLRFIRNCRALDLSHQEIRHLLAMMTPELGNCDSVNYILNQHIQHVQTRIVALQQLETQLLEIHQQCQQHCQDDQHQARCKILQGLYELENNVCCSLRTHEQRDYSHQ